MRESCYRCVCKHLGQAEVLMIEAEMGYPMHRHLAIGHLAEAEAEMLKVDPQVASYIRIKRKQYEEGAEIETLDLIRLVVESEAANEKGEELKPEVLDKETRQHLEDDSPTLGNMGLD